MTSKPRWYKLDGHTPVPTDNFEDVREYYGNESKLRIVARTEFCGVSVSTVFLCMDHSFGEGPPVLFESMIFGGPHDQEIQERYCTWEEAEEGHKRLCDEYLKWRLEEQP